MPTKAQLYFLASISLAFVLDVLLGDPFLRLHPVRLIGSMLGAFEKVFYRMRLKVLGGWLLLAAALAAVVCAALLLQYAGRFIILPFWMNPVQVMLIYFLFCNRDMVSEARSVCMRLREGDLEGAREQLQRIVGRDTARLDRRGIIRATIETIAENAVDGFTSPFFYLLIGGIPLAYTYRTVNTVDSMFGYRNARYERFGKAGARCDDVLNFFPARLNIFFMLCATGFSKRVWQTILRYGRAHPSPNSGIAEAGFSGAIGLALGGPSYYQGIEKVKPWIGEDCIEEEEREDPALIEKAISLYWRTVVLTFIAGCAVVLPLRLPLLFRFLQL